jgi:hypothetical protein
MNNDDYYEEEIEKEIIVIKTFYNEWDADIAAEHLHSHNIEAWVSPDDPVLQGMLRSARLMIRKVDKKRASNVLDAMHT